MFHDGHYLRLHGVNEWLGCFIQNTPILVLVYVIEGKIMAISEKLAAAESEVARLKVARESNWSRTVDTANLVDAIEKLRLLNLEAKETIRSLELDLTD